MVETMKLSRLIFSSLLITATTFATGATLPAAAAPSLTARQPTVTQPSARGYSPPVPLRVIRAFDNPDHNWLPGHRGVDLAADVGQPIAAAGPGTVAFAGVVAGTPSVSVEHADGLRTTYSPVYAHVQVGQTVAAGDVLGTLAPTFDGYPGLHWGALDGPDSYLNPLELLDAPTIRLKPV